MLSATDFAENSGAEQDFDSAQWWYILSESATHQVEYFLKHDHYYGTINTFLSM